MIHQTKQIIDIYRAFDPKLPEYLFYSSTNETFSMIDHMLEHETSIDKVKNIKIVLSIVSDHNVLKLEIN